MEIVIAVVLVITVVVLLFFMYKDLQKVKFHQLGEGPRTEKILKIDKEILFEKYFKRKRTSFPSETIFMYDEMYLYFSLTTRGLSIHAVDKLFLPEVELILMDTTIEKTLTVKVKDITENIKQHCTPIGYIVHKLDR